MNREKFQFIIILILIGCVIVLGALVRKQNLSMAELTQSVATLSSNVYNVAVQKKNELLNTSGKAAMKMANPASTNCSAVGGKLNIAEKKDGQYGVCVFSDGKQCEEWALYRDECPVGGIDVSELTEPADIYCAITGHEVTQADKPGSVGTCKVDDQICSAQEYFDTGECKYSVK